MGKEKRKRERTVEMVTTNLFLLGCILLLNPLSCNANTDQNDVEALNVLFQSFNSPSLLQGWSGNGGDPCGRSWRGVTCSHSRVTSIKLNGLGFTGNLSYNLDYLTSLTELDLSNNSIGGLIPSYMPPNLQTLNLGQNQFSGGIPYSMSLMTSLKTLNIGHNGLQGNLTDVFFLLSNLTTLDLSFNDLTGDLPEGFSALSSLKSLYLQNNQFTGYINVLAQLPLQTLNIQNNHFTGWIPNRLKKINTLSTDGNSWNSGLAPLPPSPFPPPPPPAPRKSSTDRPKKGHTAVTIGAIVVAIVFFVVLAFGSSLFIYARKVKQRSIVRGERKNENLMEVTLEDFGSLAPRKYTFSEIRKITKSFNQKIGQGGYASVFKGELMDGSPAAVKVFNDRESTGEEFISEVVSIARTSHVNIVRLLGFSINGSKRALIYEFMSNGSLDKYLRESQNSVLSDVVCTRLFKIAISIARGLEYLHQGCNTRIVHFDIKPHNILLDKDYCPKISDFGLAKFCQPKESIISMSGMRGTIGYIAPEVFSRNFGSVSSKSDVYSYGMMLLEMFVRKQGKMELKDFSSTETYFPDYIYKCVEQNNICSVYGISDVSAVVQKATIVGLCCIQIMPRLRPTMSEVLDMLAKRVEELTLPPSSNVTLAPELVQEVTDITASTSYIYGQ